MKELLIIAHGSRREASNDEVRCLAARLNGNQESPFNRASCAFLELADPLIPEGLERCISNGATEITVLPYFLAAGRHVVTDIPEEMRPVIEKYPGVKIDLIDHLGASDAMLDFIVQHTTTNRA